MLPVKRLHTLLALFMLVLLPMTHGLATAGTNREPHLQKVGEATLSKLFWTIYDSRLYTTSGEYRGIEPDLMLEITYQRKISSKQLIDSTRDEWQALSLYKKTSSEQWLTQLGKLWPDVDKGDVIKLQLDQQLNSHFYFNGNAIGNINDPAFTRQFLAIWLSPDSNHPEMQRQLIGSKNPLK